VPVKFNGDTGSATPISNTLDLFGDSSVGISSSASGGTVTYTLAQSIKTNASPQFVGLNLSGLTASQAVVTDGSKNLASLQYTSLNVASTIVSRDSNGNAYFNNVGSATASFSAGTIPLTVATPRYVILTASATGVTLPDATTLQTGTQFQINNNTSSTAVVNKNGGTLLTNLNAGAFIFVYLTNNSTSAGTWDYHFLIPSNAAWGTASLTVPSTTLISAGQYNLTGTSSGTISILPQAAAGTFNFNLPITAGSSGQFLTSGGGGSAPMTWTSASSVAVTSITATAPLTANGASGSAQVGAVTMALTTPLALNFGGTNANLTASNGGIFYSTATAGAILSGTATANQVLLSGSSAAPAWSTATYPATTTINQLLYSSSNNVIGGITASANGVLISSATNVPSWLAAGTTGQVLIATTSNPPSWGTLSSISVTSLMGTANQVLVNATSGSAQTGPLTVAFPATGGISIGSYQSTVPPSGGLIAPGQVSFGASSISATTYFQVAPTTSNNLGFYLTGAVRGAATATRAMLIDVQVSQSSGSSDCAMIEVFPNPASGAGTTANYRSFYSTVGSGSTNATNAYGFYADVPTVGSSKNVAAYFGNCSIGYTATNPPSSGLIVSGNVGFGTSNPGGGLDLQGTITSGSVGAIVYGALLRENFSFTTGATGCFPTGLFVDCPVTMTGTATVTDAVSIYGGAPTKSGGSIVHAYSGVFKDPGSVASSSNIALYTENLSVGYVVTPPSNGLIVSGNVGIGTSSVGFLLDVQSASNGTLVQFLTTNATPGMLIRTASDPGRAITSGERLGGYQMAGTKDNAHTFQNSATIAAFASENWNSTSAGTYLTIETTANTTTSRTAKVYVQGSGNVGIGSSGDVNKLDVSGAVAIGSGFVASLAPTNGAIIQGSVGIGTSTPSSNTKVQSVSTNSYNMFLTGTQASVDGSSVQASILIQSILQPTSGATLVAGVYSSPNLAAASGQTISFACGEYINPTVASSIGTITSYLGLYLGLGDNTTTGTVSNAYNLYVSQPFAGSSGNYYAASIQGGLVLHWVSTATDYTAKKSDTFIAVTNTSAGRTITLPSSVPDAGWVCTIKDESGGAATHNIVISGNGHNIDGGASGTIVANYGVARIYSNGTQYYSW
jgi:hypothetical protein